MPPFLGEFWHGDSNILFVVSEVALFEAPRVYWKLVYEEEVDEGSMS